MKNTSYSQRSRQEALAIAQQLVQLTRETHHDPFTSEVLRFAVEVIQSALPLSSPTGKRIAIA